MSKGNIKIFVYGTLMGCEDAPWRQFIKDVIFIGRAYIIGTLYDFGAYPGVKLKGEGQVQGELWEVPAYALHVFDRYEGYPDLYDRKMVDVTARKGKAKAWVYTCNITTTIADVITSGDWTKRNIERKKTNE